MEDELHVARYQTRSNVHKDLGHDSFSVFMEQIWCGKSAGPPYGEGNTMELCTWAGTDDLENGVIGTCSPLLPVRFVQ
jgi:hypothetical protein